MDFSNMYELAKHVELYDSLLREENAIKTASHETLYKNLVVSYTLAWDMGVSYVNIMFLRS